MRVWGRDRRLWLATALALLLAGCATAPPRTRMAPGVRSGVAAYNRSYVVGGERYHVLPQCGGYVAKGIASWYGPGFNGHKTSTGATYNMYAMTAASKVLPLPCRVRITNLENGRHVVVTVNDRGPFVANRILDLSYAAAKRLDMIGTGTAIVEAQAVDAGHGAANPPPPRSVAQGAPAPRLYLQVGAFMKRASATHLRTALDALGFGPVVVQRGPIFDAARLYVVRLGPLADVKAVDVAAGRMQSLGIRGFQVRVE